MGRSRGSSPRGRRMTGPSGDARPGRHGSRACGRGITRVTHGPVARLVGLMSAHRRWIAAGALLGFLAIASNVALVAMSAFLVSRAAVVDNVAEIALAVTAVRVLAIGRAAFRYLERYATHVATLRILADVRVWFYAAIEPLAPARLTTRRSGDLLARIVADVETLEDFYIRVILPPIVAVLVTTFACVLLGVFNVTLGVVLLGFLVLVGVVLPLLTRWLSREVSERAVRTRGELSAAIVDEVNGLADLIALDRADSHRATVLAIGADLDRTRERQALFRGLSVGLAALLTSLCAVSSSGWLFRSWSVARWTASISRCCRLRPSRHSRPFSPCRCPSSCSAGAGRPPDASSRSSMPRRPLKSPSMPVFRWYPVRCTWPDPGRSERHLPLRPWRPGSP